MVVEYYHVRQFIEIEMKLVGYITLTGVELCCKLYKKKVKHLKSLLGNFIFLC